MMEELKKGSGKKRAGKKKKGKKIKRKRLQPRSKKLIAFGIGLGVLLLLAVASLVIVFYYKTTTYIVNGTTRYTDDEIISMVVDTPLKENTLYLNWKYGNKGITSFPFIEKIDVQVASHDSVRLIVYEKALAGYISYLGQYMYFDREGVVVEAGGEKIEGVPQVLGLNFDYVVLNERLPVENETVFEQILSITQLLDKYSLDADRIFFDAGYSTYLYFGSVECDLGDSAHLEEKLEQLSSILPELEGKSGIIRLKDYSPGSGSIIFEAR